MAFWFNMQIMNLFVARPCGFCFNSSCEKIWKRLHELRYLEKILIHVVGIKLRNKICFQEDHSRMFVKLHNKNVECQCWTACEMYKFITETLHNTAWPNLKYNIHTVVDSHAIAVEYALLLQTQWRAVIYTAIQISINVSFWYCSIRIGNCHSLLASNPGTFPFHGNAVTLLD